MGWTQENPAVGGRGGNDKKEIHLWQGQKTGPLSEKITSQRTLPHLDGLSARKRFSDYSASGPTSDPFCCQLSLASPRLKMTSQ